MDEKNQKPDFKNDDINLLMEEEMRATLEDRDRRRRHNKIGIRIGIVFIILSVIIGIGFPVGCVYLALKGPTNNPVISK